MALQGAVGMQPEELNEDELADINEETGWHKKDHVPGEVTPAKGFMQKESLEIAHSMGSNKIRC